MLDVLKPSLLVMSLLVALAACAFPRLVLDREGRVHPILGGIAWAAAVLLILKTMLTVPLNDDEVFYLAHSWGATLGEPTSGDLPLRSFLMRPYLWGGGSPSTLLWISRGSVVLLALACGVMVRAMLTRLEVTRNSATVAGAILVVILANLPMVLVRPEYYACFLGIASLLLLSTSPGGAARSIRWFAAGLIIGVTITLSLRQEWLIPAAFVSLGLELTGRDRKRAFAWTLAGLVIAIAPSAVYLAMHETFASIRYWNTVFPRLAGWSGAIKIEYPYLAAAATAGFLSVWRSREPRPGVRTMACFWLFAGVSNVITPMSAWYALGIWHAAGIVLTAVAFASRTVGPMSRRQLQARVFVFALLAVPPLVLAVRPSLPLRTAVRAYHELVGQQHLNDWLGQVAGPGPVMCVAPYHPIRTSNAWRMTNGWWYLRIEDPNLNRTLNGDLVAKLESGRARVIAWNAFSAAGGKTTNLLRYGLGTGVIPPVRAPEVARQLMQRYRLVEWRETIPESYGGTRYLIPRDWPVDARVEALADTVVLHAAGVER